MTLLSDLAPRGLRARILLTVGLTATVIMMVMSWAMLYSWRRSLVHQEKANAQAVSRAFSVAVIDALIFANQDLYQSEGFLGNYVDLFMTQNSRLRAITILDPGGAVVARSWNRQDPPWVSGNRETLLSVDRPLTTITETTEGPWVLETVLPLQTGERRWGVLVLAIEADSIRHQIRRNFFQLATFYIAVTSIMLLMLWMMLSRILGSLRALVRAMDTVDFTPGKIPALPYRRDEIGLLYKHFHHMQLRVDQSRSDLLKAQHQVWHAERLAAIGRLASGLAHEINNPLNGIRNCIYAIRGDLDNRKQTAEYLEMMDEGLTHASGVIDKLLGFVRKQQAGMGPVDLNEAIEAVRRLVAFNLERKNISLEVDLDPELPLVSADRQLIQEVMMNLLLNAVDAVDEQGKIKVATSTRAGEVILNVCDRGHGIAADQLDKVFDPFFTTKQAGEGTGLGLSISLGIIQAHGGKIDVTSQPGAETVFTISIPVLEDEAEKEADA
jgi:signal transduction histidine kinase